MTKFPADLVTFTEEILNGKLHFLCSVASVFIPTPTIIFSYGVEIFLYPLVQLIGHVSALSGYIEM